ncbi:hypothetical protein [Nonomuraea sp. NPDC050310]|uniref:hypothetical protein n=1 Tax=Nonomuraea sp. NPDC050310 TaxID=3154935 RepID=UPI0033E1109A
MTESTPYPYKYSDGSRRREIVEDLRSLADFLESHPELPTPRHVDVMVFPRHEAPADADAVAEVRRIAAQLGVRLNERSGHYTATHMIGHVSYRVISATSPPAQGGA